MKAPRPSYSTHAPIVAAEPKVVPIPRYCPVAIPGNLMPYEAAAKAIFIRANGALAYYEATGIVEEGVPSLELPEQ